MQIVITNPTSADLAVQGITFSIPVGEAQDTLTAGNDIHHRVSDSAWTVTLLDDDLTETTTRYLLGPWTGGSVTLAAGASVMVQFYGFQTHDQPGTATITIKEQTAEGTGFAHFTVTTFPWGFTFSDLAANVHDGSGWKPVAQVDNGSSVTLTWHSSVAETTAYQIYCSTSEGQSAPYTPTLPGQWTSPKLTMDTVFTVVVNPPGLGLTASMSTVVAVRNADVRLKSLTVGNKALVVSDGAVSIATNGGHACSSGPEGDRRRRLDHRQHPGCEQWRCRYHWQPPRVRRRHTQARRRPNQWLRCNRWVERNRRRECSRRDHDGSGEWGHSAGDGKVTTGDLGLIQAIQRIGYVLSRIVRPSSVLPMEEAERIRSSQSIRHRMASISARRASGVGNDEAYF